MPNFEENWTDSYREVKNVQFLTLVARQEPCVIQINRVYQGGLQCGWGHAPTVLSLSGNHSGNVYSVLFCVQYLSQDFQQKDKALE
jgi:hypothetical protein